MVIFGPAACGKSQLLHVLLGQQLSQGSRVQISRDTASNPAFDGIEIVLSDAAILQDIDLVDGGWPGDGNTDIKSMLAIADIALWCTQEFTQQEAEVWTSAPEHLKDHSFLVLTKADVLAQEQTLQSRIAAMSAVANQEFHGLFPTTTRVAMSELERTGSITDKSLAASGVKALATAVSKLAAEGRQADLDAALLFLNRQGIDLAEQPVSHPAPAAETPDTYGQALNLLRCKMAALDLPETDDTDAAVQSVLTHCEMVSEELVELISGAASNEADFTLWCEDVYSAADKITLIGLEDTMGAAADAVGILAQITRELETRMVH